MVSTKPEAMTMRKAVFGLLGLLLATEPAAAVTCYQPNDLGMFQMATLKSEMMVAALACRKEDRYNAAIRRFRSQFAAADRGLLNVFMSSSAGRSGHDRYITALANSRSQAMIAAGDAYCAASVSLFNEISAMSSARAIARLAAKVGHDGPVGIPACPGETTETSRSEPTLRQVARFDPTVELLAEAKEMPSFDPTAPR